MDFELSLKLNNQNVTDYNSPIKTVDRFPTLNWEFDTSQRVVVDSTTGIASPVGELSQKNYEVRVSNSFLDIGSDAFVGNMSNDGLQEGQEFFWRYNGASLVRGATYFGQIRATDESDRQSDWATFSFSYNSLPYVYGVSISPSSPSVTDNLVLSYTFSDADSNLESGSKIRWFKNGVYQKQFNDALIIESFNLQNNDIWNADVYPSDGYEFGARATSPHVLVSNTAVEVSSLNILPKNPNPDDILKADYLASNESEQDNVLIRWYINNFRVSDFNDRKYVKLPVEAGDSVRFEVKHVNSGTYESSAAVTIEDSDYVVTNIIIDGKIDSLNISSTTPLVQWNSFIPNGKVIEYISVKIGTFYESDNIYSTILPYNGDSFTIPPNLLSKGGDYYISIAASDTQTFSKYTTGHFRVHGSRWEESVSNSTGWTMEMFFDIPSDGAGEIDYQIIRINDGSKFAEIRLYSSRIVLISGSKLIYDNISSFNASNLNIAGKGNNIKIYLNKILIINGEGIFTQESNIKRLELGSSASDTFRVRYKYLFYTTSGYFLPGEDSEYSNMQFHTYMEFEDNEVVALNSYSGGQYVFGLNPDNANESSSIYSIVTGESSIKCSTVARTFSPINRISKSPDDNITVYAHAKGATVIKGYVINPFNHELVFVDNNGVLNETFPDDNGWELVSNTNFTAAYFNSEGLNINTLGEI